MSIIHNLFSPINFLTSLKVFIHLRHDLGGNIVVALFAASLGAQRATSGVVSSILLSLQLLLLFLAVMFPSLLHVHLVLQLYFWSIGRICWALPIPKLVDLDCRWTIHFKVFLSSVSVRSQVDDVLKLKLLPIDISDISDVWIELLIFALVIHNTVYQLLN